MTTPREVLREAKDLPTLPTAVARLSELIEDKSAGASQFEKVVKPDPALTANLLRLANSPFFGLRREVTSVRQAIALMGINRVFELAASASFKQVLPKKIPGYEIEASAFWLHSIAVGVMAEKLADTTRLAAPEMIFTAGLLHDIGKLAISSILVAKSQDVLGQMWENDISFVESEKTALGTDHAEVGELMAQEWNLPCQVEWAARWHHEPNEAPEDVNQSLVDLVHIADGMAHLVGFGADVGELGRSLEGDPMERLGIGVQDVEQTAGATIGQIREMGENLSGLQGGLR
ncbi:MAG: HDOD domain-containing protein [Deltaproteobacteria bacterium]|nr:HDOD domain-containing protein [Deltaproteobacteria bacterium]